MGELYRVAALAAGDSAYAAEALRRHREMRVEFLDLTMGAFGYVGEARVHVQEGRADEALQSLAPLMTESADPRMRILAERGPTALELPASEVMTAKVNTCERGDQIPELMSRMTQGRFRHLPVVEDGNLIGMISIGDVVRVRMDEVESEAEALRSFITQ